MRNKRDGNVVCKVMTLSIWNKKTVTGHAVMAALVLVLTGVWPLPGSAGISSWPLREWQQGFEISDRNETESVVIARNGIPTRERLRGVRLEGGELYLRLYDLAAYLGARDRFDIKNKYELFIEDRQLKFTLGSSIVIIDNQSSRAVNLPRPVIVHRGAFYAPAEGIALLLTAFTGKECEYLPQQGWLNYGGSGLNVLGIRLQHRPEQGTEVEILLTEPLSYETFSHEAGALNITFEGARADVAALMRVQGQGLVRSIEVFEQRDNVLQISFRLSRRYQGIPDFYRTSEGLLFVLRNSAAGERLENSGSTFPSSPAFGIRNVVIDAGHGGKDPGSIGPTGLREKEVALDIARRLQELFRRDPRTQDINVIMTREDDEFVPLGDRYAMANNSKGDLFISIHANAFNDPSVNGFMTFFLAEAKNDEARQIAAFENTVLRYEENSRALQIDETELMLRGILGELISTKFLEESQVLAGLVQDELRGRIRHQVRDRRIDQGPFLVLNGASMPSVLVEIAFISNRAEEIFLRQNSFKNKVAEALHAAVISYRERVEVGR